MDPSGEIAIAGRTERGPYTSTGEKSGAAGRAFQTLCAGGLIVRTERFAIRSAINAADVDTESTSAIFLEVVVL